ncbi:MAG: DUF5317 domain-containing protein [Chloroflexi bacterium]|nr:DUF5317 domain-containing protein [Chloroflexota bacterium]
MFILYAIPIGILAGLALGGRLGRLGDLRLRWAPLAVLGLLVQVVLFADPVSAVVGDAAPAIYVGSTAAVLVAVLRDVRVPGMAVIALGAASNLAAIVANGGYMPADPAALASVVDLSPGYSNSVVVADPALRPLTDLYALPAAIPFANVFSVGDVLIGVGVAFTIAFAMRAAPPAPAAPAA